MKPQVLYCVPTSAAANSMYSQSTYAPHLDHLPNNLLQLAEAPSRRFPPLGWKSWTHPAS